MNDIKQSYEIPASPADVWRALTDPAVIREWSGANAYLVLQPGARYTLWDGDIGGEIVDVVPLQKLVQTWKPHDWTRMDSVVTFLLTPQGKGTRVDLLHVNVEESDYDGTTEGWDTYYLGAIKRMFEARAPKPKRAAAKKKPIAKKAKAAKKKTTKKKTVAKKKNARR